MAEIKERSLKVLQGLSQMTEPIRPTEIGNMVGETPLNVGIDLSELLKAGLAEKTDETQNLWSVTEKGTEYVSNLDIESLSQPSVTVTEPVTKTAPVTEIPPEKTAETVPSQSDLFRAEGERLGIGKGIRTIS